MPDERELSAAERGELESQLPRACRLAGLDREPAAAPGVVVRAVNDLVGRLNELNLLLMFNMAGAGSLPPASGRQYMPLG